MVGRTQNTPPRQNRKQYIKETDERQMELPFAQAAAAAEREADTEKSHRMQQHKRAARGHKVGQFEESRQPIVLDKLIEHMLNESFK